MRPTARWSFASAVILLLALGLWARADDWEYTATSYGSIPQGTGALHELLGELSLSRGRSFGEGAALPRDATVWWIAPGGLCAGVEDGDLSEADSGIWHSLGWMQAGGTAVVFLPDVPLPCLSEIEVAGRALPQRPVDVEALAESPDDEPAGPGAGAEDGVGPEGAVVLAGPLHPERRSLGAVPLRFFADAAGLEVLAHDEHGRALLVSATLGEGRLVLAATAAPLRNAWLDHADAALFAVDLALSLGPPLLDEREHGLLPSPHPIPYLLGSAALPAFAGAALLAGVALWWGRALLPPTLEPDVPPAPTLEAFVSSVAALYAGTRDHTALLRSYQEFAVSQLRRVFRLPPDVPEGRVCERALAARALSEDALRPLLDRRPCRGASELARKTRSIDALLARVAG